MKTDADNLRARIRRRLQDKIFMYAMAVLSLAFIYCFGWRPNWLYMGATEVLRSRNWWIDTYAHGIFGVGLSWVLIYGDRLSTEPPRRWARNIVACSILFGAIWEFGVEMPFDLLAHPWIEHTLLPYLAEHWQIFLDVPEKMQKGNIDTSVDLLATFLGAISGLILWKFVWRPAYAFLLPSQAREEFLDELSELYKHSREKTKEIWRNFRSARKKERKNKSDKKPL